MSDKNFAKQIKKLRKSLGMNQKDFAAKLDIRQSTLSSYENGAISPSTDMLMTIAKQFHVSIDWLCGLSEAEAPLNTISDIIDFFFKLEKIRDIKFDINISSNAKGVQTTGISFFAEDNEHPLNLEICNFLASYADNRSSFESYFTSKEMYELWREHQISYYSDSPLIKKEFEDLDTETRIKLRDKILEDKLK